MPESEDKSKRIFGRFKEGIGLGTEELIAGVNIVDFRTFISNEMIFESQVESFNFASDKYKTYWDEEYKFRKMEAF